MIKYILVFLAFSLNSYSDVSDNLEDPKEIPSKAKASKKIYEGTNDEIRSMVNSAVSERLNSDVLQVGKVYRLNQTIDNIILAGDDIGTGDKKYTAVKDSKFEVIDDSNERYYVVKFITLYNFNYKDIDEDNQTIVSKKVRSTVRKDLHYLLDKKRPNNPTKDHPALTFSATIEKSTSLSTGGPVSGPLIVPFKYRLDDNSLTGEATVGYYAGFNFEPSIPGTNKRIPISPFIAGGLTQISVDEEDGESSNQTGVSLATGILIHNWDRINIGLAYGTDRIGDKEWKYEADGWVSFMIGWQL